MNIIKLKLKMFFLWLVSWLYVFLLIAIFLGISYLLFLFIKGVLIEYLNFCLKERNRHAAKSIMVFIFFFGVISLFPLFVVLNFLIQMFSTKKEKNEYNLSGLKLDKKIFNNLYNFVDEIRLKLKVPKIKEIIIDPSINSQIFEFKKSFFSPRKRCLIIGFPFFIIFSLDELKAIIAHEMAHMLQSKKLTKKLNKVKRFYKEYISSSNMDRVEEKILSFPLFCEIVSCINDLLLAYSKENEFDADRRVLKIVDKDLYANVLLKIKYYTSVINSFSENLLKELCAEYQEPIQDYFNRLEQYILGRDETEYFNGYINKINEEEPFVSPTHATLRERLENINAKMPTSISVNSNLLSNFFTKEQTSILFEKMNILWKETIAQRWKINYQDYKRKANIKKMDKASIRKYERRKNLSEYELFKKAYLISCVYGEEKALKEYKKLEELYPDDMNIKYLIGKILLKKSEQEGIKYLDYLVQNSEEFALSAAKDLYNYYFDKKDFVNSAKYFNICVSKVELDRMIYEERINFNVHGNYSPSFFDANTINNIIHTIKTKYPSVKKVYLFEKHSGYIYIMVPVYIIGIKYKKYDENVHNNIINECLISFKHTVLSLNSRADLEYYLSEFVGGRIL